MYVLIAVTLGPACAHLGTGLVLYTYEEPVPRDLLAYWGDDTKVTLLSGSAEHSWNLREGSSPNGRDADPVARGGAARPE